MTPPLIGILAGMGPRSTAPFIDLVIDQCQQQYGARHDIDFPKMLICSQPAPFFEDRPVDHAALEAATREGLVDLDRAGCSVLAIACNTAHIYYPALAESVKAPLLNIVELGVAALPRSARKVALVAARATVEAGIYQRALDRSGIARVEPAWQEEIDALLSTTRETTDPRLAQASDGLRWTPEAVPKGLEIAPSASPTIFAARWQSLFDQARAQGADTVLVACLDLSGILKHAPDTLPVVDAAAALAAAIVRTWLTQRDHFLKAAA